ncbi:hypothetical protein SFC88_08170 [Nocardioides sp. HM23]|uniref:hypothetical protein n=1 Tax=Nocardioides bizhenqiangii TaxID=3095076 RepID=UPI002ACA1D46|nr:hypothetical protein [Nocardioides sp. HM23]MDZ5620797.1 hypothetical protein [Nocardioides sp. HM23]
MDDREVERRMRAGLEAKAMDADVTAPVVDRARAEVGRRRRARWSVGAAAAAVVLVVGGIAVATAGGDDGADEPPPGSTPTASGPRPADLMSWRTEFWAGVSVDVPPDWGYGGAPDASGTACYPIAAVSPDGQEIGSGGDHERGWVGRPIAGTDVCASVPRPWEPQAPYVWLGAGVEPGTYDYGNGYVQETIAAEGTTVTVGTDDPALREQILASVRPGQRCASEVGAIPEPRAGAASDRRGGLIRAKVCAYRRTGSGYQLSYAVELEPAAAEVAFAAAERAPGVSRSCDPVDDPTEFVLLHATYNDEFPNDVLDRTAVYRMECGGSIRLDDGPSRELTPESVAPWARNGIPAVVHGPTGGKGAMIDSFIGPQG